MTLLCVLVSLNILAVCVVGFVLCDISRKVESICCKKD